MNHRTLTMTNLLNLTHTTPGTSDPRVKGVGRPLDFAVFHPTTLIGHCSCQSLSPPGKGHAGPIGLKSGEAVRPTGGDPNRNSGLLSSLSQSPHVIGDLLTL